MTEITREVGVKMLSELIEEVLSTDIKKKKVILKVYQAYLAVRKHPSYAITLVHLTDHFEQHVWKGDQVAESRIKQKVVNIGLQFSNLNESDASELYSFIETRLGQLAGEASLEEFLIRKFELGGPGKPQPGNRLVTIVNSALARQVMDMQLRTAFSSGSDANHLNIPTHGKELSNTEIILAVTEFYSSRGFALRTEGSDTVYVLQEDEMIHRVFMTNYSGLPLAYGKILISINDFGSDGRELD